MNPIGQDAVLTWDGCECPLTVVEFSVEHSMYDSPEVQIRGYVKSVSTVEDQKTVINPTSVEMEKSEMSCETTDHVVVKRETLIAEMQTFVDRATAANDAYNGPDAVRSGLKAAIDKMTDEELQRVQRGYSHSLSYGEEFCKSQISRAKKWVKELTIGEGDDVTLTRSQLHDLFSYEDIEGYQRTFSLCG